jgi:putative methionine-R-sulfoxide reductase with GAF domain
VTQTATSPQRKPALDEASFQQLLTAAYVLQEHNDRLRGKEVHTDFAKNLSAIVETQKLIQTLQLDLEAAAKLVAERVQKITKASGAAIGIIEKSELVYRAGTGTASIDAGTSVLPASSLSSDCLSQGSAVNYTDTSTNSPARAKLFLDRNVKSFIAVPVYHAGQVAGVLELRFVRTNSFREADLRTAELMAGLLSEAMATAARMKWKDALASERQSMLEALERIKPQLERLGTGSPDHAVAKPDARLKDASVKAESSASRHAGVCAVCGSDFFDRNEAFCGICGTARPATPPPSGEDVSRHPAQRLSSSVVRPDKGNAQKPGAPVITPYGAEESGNGNSRSNTLRENAPANVSVLPASLQELIELSAIQQNPAAHVERHFEKREVLKPASPEPDFFVPAPDPSAKRNPLRQSAEQFPVTDHFAPAVRAVAVNDPFADKVIADRAAAETAGADNALSDKSLPERAHDSLRIVPADAVAGALAPIEPVAGQTVAVLPAGSSDTLQVAPWGSAKKTQEWLETVRTHRGPTARWMAHQWQTRRANIYIGLAALILVIVISGWGIRPSSTAIAGNGSPTSSGQQQPAAPKLTAFESLLVSLGLAEAPPAPIYMGNPDTQVWVDVHTALYHCPGSDLFGKTPDGKLTSQRDAQQDQFEPANRKACP